MAAKEIRVDRRGRLRCVYEGHSYVVREGGAGAGGGGVRYRYYFTKNDVPVSCTAEMRRFAATVQGGAPGDADTLRPELWEKIVSHTRWTDLPALGRTSTEMARMVEAQTARIRSIRDLPLDGDAFQKAVAEMPKDELRQLRAAVGDVLFVHPFQAQHEDPEEDEREFRVFQEFSQKNDIINDAIARLRGRGV